MNNPMNRIEKLQAHLNDATETLDYRKKLLVERVAGNSSAVDLMTNLNKVAEAEGTVATFTRALKVLDGIPHEDLVSLKEMALDFLSDLLAEGANDSWSGRTNDVNRSKFDGVREASKKISSIFCL